MIQVAPKGKKVTLEALSFCYNGEDDDLPNLDTVDIERSTN